MLRALDDGALSGAATLPRPRVALPDTSRSRRDESERTGRKNLFVIARISDRAGRLSQQVPDGFTELAVSTTAYQKVFSPPAVAAGVHGTRGEAYHRSVEFVARIPATSI